MAEQSDSSIAARDVWYNWRRNVRISALFPCSRPTEKPQSCYQNFQFLITGIYLLQMEETPIISQQPYVTAVHCYEHSQC